MLTKEIKMNVSLFIMLNYNYLNSFALILFDVFQASSQGNLELVKYLVEKGSNICEKTNKGQTVLHLGVTIIFKYFQSSIIN